MLSCLSLISDTHVRVARDGEAHRTACGLSVMDEYVEPGLFVGAGLFATAADTATCTGCRRAVGPRGGATDPARTDLERTDPARTAPARTTPAPTSSDRTDPPADPKSLARQLFEQVLNANAPDGLAELLDAGLLDGFPAHRVNRLHGLFPGWHATIEELIAEGERVVVLYRVDRVDLPAERATGQTVILRFAGHRIVQVEAIVDDFALWAAVSYAGTGSGTGSGTSSGTG
ncbi:MAG: SnoaL-like polyketide cyclase [Streptomyces sp.]|nr:SnoaL-like polyketide cyclase [Streptomyces sp.]